MKILQGLQIISQKQTTPVTVKEGPGTVDNELSSVTSKVPFLEKKLIKTFFMQEISGMLRKLTLVSGIMPAPFQIC